MRAYSIDLRERVLAAYECDEPTAEIAERFSVSPAWARRVRQRWRELGAVGPLPRRRGPTPKLDDADLARLSGLWADAPDATLAELRGRLHASTGKLVSVSTVDRALAALGLSLKKSRTGPASKTART